MGHLWLDWPTAPEHVFSQCFVLACLQAIGAVRLGPAASGAVASVAGYLNALGYAAAARPLLQNSWDAADLHLIFRVIQQRLCSNS